MIHTAKILVRIPDRRWAQRMQMRRDKTPDVTSFIAVEDKYIIWCDRNEVEIKTLQGGLIDDGSELEYEFVTYDKATQKVILATCVGEEGGVSAQLDALFPKLRKGEAYNLDRVFLITSPTNTLAEGWALAPTGTDAHNDFGMYASQHYLKGLLRETRS